MLEKILRTFGGNVGYRLVREISYSRDGRCLAIPWMDADSQLKEKTIDLNYQIENQSCPFCNDNREKNVLVDQVREVGGVNTRKVVYQCPGCDFIFTNEKRGTRGDYFRTTPYQDDVTGIRRDRELDLISIGMKIASLSENCNILIYGSGNTNTRQFLVNKGLSNVWASDVAENAIYDEYTINTGKQPDYFKKAGLRFDLIIAVEVWEHYAREDIKEAFRWLFEHISDRGLLLATTSLWYPQNSDPIFNASKESGIEQLKWWHYLHFLDHTSFYTEKNIKLIAGAHGFSAEFAYFSDERVHREDPFKRAICIAHDSNLLLGKKIRKEFSGRFLDLFYY